MSCTSHFDSFVRRLLMAYYEYTDMKQLTSYQLTIKSAMKLLIINHVQKFTLPKLAYKKAVFARTLSSIHNKKR